jgi:hypothetical protein
MRQNRQNGISARLFGAFPSLPYAISGMCDWSSGEKVISGLIGRMLSNANRTPSPDKIKAHAGTASTGFATNTGQFTT